MKDLNCSSKKWIWVWKDWEPQSKKRNVTSTKLSPFNSELGPFPHETITSSFTYYIEEWNIIFQIVKGILPDNLRWIKGTTPHPWMESHSVRRWHRQQEGGGDEAVCPAARDFTQFSSPRLSPIPTRYLGAAIVLIRPMAMGGFPGGSEGKASAYNMGDHPGSFPGRSSGEEMAPHPSTLAWKIPWTEKPGRLQSMG